MAITQSDVDAAKQKLAELIKQGRPVSISYEGYEIRYGDPGKLREDIRWMQREVDDLAGGQRRYAKYTGGFY
jgi:hypothetical protein